MRHEDCLEKAIAERPSLAQTGRTAQGRYWRNLPANEVSFRYGDQSGQFGRRIKCLKWESNSFDGLSVNGATCSCAACSILLHNEPHRHRHVVCIDIAALSAMIDLAIEAVYMPLTKAEDGVENPCHYLLLPTEGRIEDFIVKLDRVAHSDFPADKPKTPEQRLAWEDAQARFSVVFQLEIDVGVVA